MEAFGNGVQPFLTWLLETTLVASVVICLILVLQKLLGRRLGPRWSHALWLVLLLRMVLPWTPPSPVSLFSLIPASLQRDTTREATDSISREDAFRPADSAGTTEGTTAAAPPPAESPVGPAKLRLQETAGPPAPLLMTLRRMLPLLWLAGAILIGGYLAASNFALWRIVKREHPLVKQPILELFEQCKSEMDVETIVALVPSDQVSTAALFGFIRPRLLLPREMVDTASREELRYVFLHELAHLKRHDIYLGWLTSLLQVLHWFNPLVWLAFYRMRSDRELACDALVLTRTRGEESHNYGRTMVGLLGRFSRSRPLPAMAGILESKTQLKRRIDMIARFQSDRYRWSPLAVVLLLALAGLTLPNAPRSTAMAAGNLQGPAAAVPAQSPGFHKLQIPNKIPWEALLSPDGQSIAFVSEDKLWIMPRTSRLGADYPGAPRLVDTGAMKVDWAGLAWSGDGRRIAFNSMKRDEEPKGNSRMCVVSVAGGTPKQVYENYRETRIYNYRMSLSPNGETLAFASVDGNEVHIYSIAVDGGTPRRLVETPAREPVFSPDGKWIAYVEDKFRGRQGGSLWIVPAEGGTSRRVAEAGNATSPVWSPDGRRIAFLDLKGQMATTQIHLSAVDGEGENPGEKTTIDCPGADEITRLTGWTPDNGIGAIFRGHIEYGLYTFPVKGGTARLVEHGTYACLPRWSPDGKRIIFSTSTIGSGSSWTAFGTAFIPAEGGEVTTIPIPSDLKISKPAWGAGNHVSPDGKTIVFSGRKSGDGEETFVRGAYANHIWTLPLEGGKPAQLTHASVPFMDWFPCWSPDGKTVAFVRAKDSPKPAEAFREAGICLVPAEGGEPRQLTSEADAFVFGAVAWSPNGKLLAYFSADKEHSKDSLSLRVIPVEGGDSRLVGKVPAINWNIELVWSPDSKRIALNGCKDENVIRIMSLSDGSTVDITPDLVNPSSIWHLDWSRDGEQLVFAGGQGSGDPEFWMIENFLPTGKAMSGTASIADSKRPTMTMRMVQKEIEDHVSISPDGRYLCGCGTWAEAEEGITIRELATGEQHTIKPTKRIPEESGPQDPIMSPDNKWIAYRVSWQERADVYLIASDGSEQRLLYPGVIRSITEPAGSGLRLPYPGMVRPIQWFPQGNRFLGLRWRDPMHAFQEIEIVSVSASNGSAQVIKTLTGELFGTTVRLSPDGRYVAYELASKDDPKKHDIFAIEIDSKHEMPLIGHAADDRLLGWTPDGNHILFISDRTNSWSAWLLPVAKGQAQGTPELVARSTGDIKPVGFAVNGSYYYRMRYSAGDIYTATIDMTTGQLLSAPAPLEAAGSNCVADWSPDGKYLAYCSKPVTSDGPHVIRIRSLETGKERELVNKHPGFNCLRWSPDGRSLLTSSLVAYRPEDASWPSWVCRIDVATGESANLLEEKHNYQVLMAELSPDGNTLFYNTGLAITRRDINTGQESEIFKYTSEAPWAAWALSPDGEFIAAGCNEVRDANQSDGWIKKVLLITSQDGQATELLRWQEPAGYLTNMSWSPDGKNVLFTLHKNEKQIDEFWQVSTEGGQPRKIMETKSSMGRPYGLRVHPDGQRIVFSESVVHGELWMMENFLPAAVARASR